MTDEDYAIYGSIFLNKMLLLENTLAQIQRKVVSILTF